MQLQYMHTTYTHVYSVTVNKAGDTPFSLACINSQWNIVKYLVKACHCDPKSKLLYIHLQLSTPTHVYTVTVNKAGDTPLSLACINSQWDIVKFLVKECHSDPNSKLHMHLLQHSVHPHMRIQSQ